MRHYPGSLIHVILLCLMFRGASGTVPQKVDTTKREELRLGYELILTRCRGSSCRTVSALKGEVRLLLEIDDPSSMWGYEAVEEHVGKLEYQLRFWGWHALRGQAYGKALRIGFAGRVLTPFKQLTWAEKSLTRKKWVAFPVMSVSGNTYSEDGEQITPTLRVTLLKVTR